jgi:exopolysaccharide biosynthesis polyprenyl glycosylphosphotransferase
MSSNIRSIVGGNTPASSPTSSRVSVVNFNEVKSLRRWLVGLDIGGGLLAWTAVVIYADYHRSGGAKFGVAIATGAALSLITVALLAVHRLYLARVCAVRSVELSGIARSTALCALVAAWLNRVEHVGPSLTVDVLGAIFSFLVLMSVRSAYTSWLRTCRARGLFCRRVCVYGTNDEAQALVQLLQGQPELGYRVVAVLGDPVVWGRRESEILAIDPGRDPAAVAAEAGASGVLVAASAVDPLDLDHVVRHLVASGLHVQISTGLARIGHQRIRPSPLSHQLLFYVERPKLSPWQCFLKRTIDIVISSFALLLFSPLVAAAAIAIKVGDGGSITYRQERVGRNSGSFQLIKLRTMVPDASSQLAELLALNERNGPLFKVTLDPRVTPIGRFLRATSIDEIPQLLNVLRGEMSLVGPRPALPEEVAQFDDELLDRVSVQPGITGLWQVEARDSPSFHAYRRLDLFYVDNWSVVMDLTILAATFGVVVSRAFRTLRGGSEILSLTERDKSSNPPSARITPLVPAPVSDAGAVGR